MNLSDYLIDQKGIDWSSVFSEWNWLLPTDFTVWMINRYGDSILVFEDGSIHMLDLGAGKLEELASNREEFFAKIDRDDNADRWLLITLVDQCVEAGLMLGHGQCYGFKIAPIFGGKYTVENTEVMDLVAKFDLLAQIHKQINGLPDGTRVKLVVTD